MDSDKEEARRFYSDLNALESWHVSDPFCSVRYQQMLRWAPSDCDRVLDIGVGSGRGGIEIRRRFPKAHITGVDPVLERTMGAPHVYDEMVFSTAAHMDLPDSSFDFIVAGEVLEHILPKAVDQTLQEIYRLLRLRGVFVLTTPNPNDIKLRVRRGSTLGGSHVSQHFPRETCLRLRMHGFRVLALRGTGKTSLLLGTRLPVKLYGSFLIAAIKA